MNIKAINIPISNKINFCGGKEKKIISTAFSLPKDIFIKKAEKTIAKDSTESNIEQIYDSVFRDSLKLNLMANPFFNTLKIEKPTIKISQDSDLVKVAAYNFPSNTISLSEKIINSDLYMCYSQDKQTGGMTTYGIYPKDDVKEEIKVGKSLNLKVKTLKLNEKEKEFYITSSIAHELRHFFQSHLMASTEEISTLYINEQIEAVDKYNALIPAYNEHLKQIQECVDNCRKNKIKVIPELIKILNTQKPKSYVDTTYAKNYKPNFLIGKNSSINFSLYSLDYRTMTPLDLYDAATKQTKSSKNNDQSYYSNLLEIDAYNHGFEYICKSKVKNPHGLRDIVIEGMAQNAQRSYLLGMSFAKNLNQLPKTMQE